MKQGKIYLYDQYVGLLTEDETGFTFAYDANYLASDSAEAVSLTLPLSDEPYHDTVLFPFFDGLIPEGWLLNIAESSWKINLHPKTRKEKELWRNVYIAINRSSLVR